MAAAYCAWVVGVYVFHGPGPFDRNNVTLMAVIVTYIGIGIFGGAVVGLMRPFTGTKIGAYAVGFVTGFLAAFGIGFLVAGSPVSWQLPEWGTIPIFGSVAGWVIGSELWKRTGGRSGSAGTA